jgi:glycosyltransferase involved in cell wall biosynthesis
MAGEPLKISVITPTFNSAKTLPRAVESLLAQRYPRLEFLVLDGGSTDGTQDVIARYREHIAFMRSHADGGAGYAYNDGIMQATGDIIAFLNADDCYEPGILNAVNEAFRAHPECPVVTCEARLAEELPDGGMKILRDYKGRSLALDGSGSLILNARFYRRELFRKHGVFTVTDREGNYLVASDLDFIIRLALAGEKSWPLAQLGYTYFAHAGSLTFSGSRKMEERLHRERGVIAGWFLEQPGYKPPKLFRRLKRWHRIYVTRRFLKALAAKDWPEARNAAREGMHIHPVRWPIYAAKLAVQQLLGLRR